MCQLGHLTSVRDLTPRAVGLEHPGLELTIVAHACILSNMDALAKGSRV